ncbi:MAG: ATP-binding protein [Chloroflexi bacterium]|nr:ATP-binding protein [Chloroflexota bacterium]MDA1282924.1 ATP-binding protein [Chloroflexota bacterium]
MRLARITTLNAITTAVVEMHDVQSIMETATSRLAELLPADHVVGLILEPTSGDFTVVTTSGEHSLEPIPVGSKAFDSQILTPGSDEGVHNLSETGGHLDDFTYRFAAAGLYSVIGHNLAANGETYGAIIVARHEHASLGSAEVELMTAVGAAVAQAIYGARLVDDLRVMTVELVETQQRAMRQDRLRALGQMTSGITHDTNNALSPVVGFSDMLLQNRSNIDDHSRKLLQLIRLAALDISRIVERMRLIYSDREADGITFEPVDIRQMVRETIELTRPKWRDESPDGAEIRVSTDFARVLPQVPGSDTEIREALTNLVLNAVDAMPDGGRIVFTGYTEPEQSGNGGTVDPETVVVEISNEGSGMNSDTAQGALEPFFTTKGNRGTGLGLPMVQQVMKRHSGTISILPSKEKGTIARLVFPLATSITVSKPKISSERTDSPKLKILVVDDEPMLRMVVQEMLTSEGRAVEVAPGDPEASMSDTTTIQIG